MRRDDRGHRRPRSSRGREQRPLQSRRRHPHALIIYLQVNQIFTRDAISDVKEKDVAIDDYPYELPRSFFSKGVTVGKHRPRDL